MSKQQVVKVQQTKSKGSMSSTKVSLEFIKSLTTPQLTQKSKILQVPLSHISLSNASVKNQHTSSQVESVRKSFLSLSSPLKDFNQLFKQKEQTRKSQKQTQNFGEISKPKQLHDRGIMGEQREEIEGSNSNSMPQHQDLIPKQQYLHMAYNEGIRDEIIKTQRKNVNIIHSDTKVLSARLKTQHNDEQKEKVSLSQRRTQSETRMKETQLDFSFNSRLVDQQLSYKHSQQQVGSMQRNEFSFSAQHTHEDDHLVPQHKQYTKMALTKKNSREDCVKIANIFTDPKPKLNEFIWENKTNSTQKQFSTIQNFKIKMQGQHEITGTNLHQQLTVRKGKPPMQTQSQQKPAKGEPLSSTRINNEERKPSITSKATLVISGQKQMLPAASSSRERLRACSQLAVNNNSTNMAAVNGVKSTYKAPLHPSRSKEGKGVTKMNHLITKANNLHQQTLTRQGMLQERALLLNQMQSQEHDLQQNGSATNASTNLVVCNDSPVQILATPRLQQEVSQQEHEIKLNLISAASIQDSRSATNLFTMQSSPTERREQYQTSSIQDEQQQIKMVKPSQRVQSRSNRKKILNSSKTASEVTSGYIKVAKQTCISGNSGLAISSQRYSTIPTPVYSTLAKSTTKGRSSQNTASNRSRIGLQQQQHQNSHSNQKATTLGAKSSLTPMHEAKLIGGRGGLAQGQQSLAAVSSNSRLSTQQNINTQNSNSGTKEKSFKRQGKPNNNHLQQQFNGESTEQVIVRSFRPLTASNRHQRKATQSVNQSQNEFLQSDGQQTPAGLIVNGMASLASYREREQAQQMSVQLTAETARILPMYESIGSSQNYPMSTTTPIDQINELHHNQLLQYQTQQQQQQQYNSTTNRINEQSSTQEPGSENMIINQQQQHAPNNGSNNHRQSSSNHTLPSVASRTGVELQNLQNNAKFLGNGGEYAGNTNDYFVLDNENRVILVSSTGVHPNTTSSVLVQQQANNLLNNGANVVASRSHIHKPSKSSNTRLNNENCARPSVNFQHKIMEQIAGGKTVQKLQAQSHKTKQTSSKVTQALKENSEQQYNLSQSQMQQQTVIYQDGSSGMIGSCGGLDLNSQQQKVNQHQYFNQPQQVDQSGNTRNESINNAKGNRNSNQNMKTVGSGGVTRFGHHHGSTFSATQSTYQSLAGVSQQQTQNVPTAINTSKGVIYQLDQNFNYKQQQQQQQQQSQLQQSQLNQAANNTQSPAITQPVMNYSNSGNTPGSKAARHPQQQSMSAQRQPAHQQYFSSAQQQQILQLQQMNQISQMQAQQILAAQQAQAQAQAQGVVNSASITASQKIASMKAASSSSNNRPRPRSSAPAVSNHSSNYTNNNISNIKSNQNRKYGANLAQSRDSRVLVGGQHQQAELVGPPRVVSKSKGHPQLITHDHLNSEQQTHQLHHSNDKHLMQTTGHIIVSGGSNGTTPMNELQMPMIINQTQVTGNLNAGQSAAVVQQIQAANASGQNNTLCITGLMHPDIFVQPQQQAQQQTIVLATQMSSQSKQHGSASSQPSSKRREANLQHASTQNGFFGKRKNRDRDNKTTMNSTSNNQNSKGSKGPSVAISNPQGYVVQGREQNNYQSNNGSQGGGSGSQNTRPLTGKHSSSFHKTQASISMKNAVVNNEGANLHHHINNIITGDSDTESINRQQKLVGSGADQAVAPKVGGGMVVMNNNLGIIKRSSVQGKQQSQLIIDAGTSTSHSIVSATTYNNSIQHQKNLSSVRSGQLINVANSISSDHEGVQNATHNSKNGVGVTEFAPQKQQLAYAEKTRILNQSASPSTKISIRGRKGMSSIIGTGGTAGTTTGPGLQMLPSTPKNYKRTKRVLFARRMNLMDRPMLIITFQGVLGDFMKKQVTGLKEHPIVPTPLPVPTTAKEKKKASQKEPEEESVNLRAGAIEGLRYLSQLFQLVIFSRETIEDSWFESQGGQVASSEVQTKAILNFLQQNPDIKLDGFYASIFNAKSQTMTDDYSQIFIDFGLNSEQKVQEKVLFVSSIASDFICNQRLPATGNISPRGKKPNAVQLGISYARGLTDIDNQGYFMFDTSCHPPQPLVKGLPISLEMKQHQQATRLSGTRSSSIVADTKESTSAVATPSQAEESLLGQAATPASSVNFEMDSEVTTRQMPSTLLVPNLRTQNAKTQTNFSHVLKSIMMLAFLGQKKTNGKHILKEAAVSDYTGQLMEIEADFGNIKEKQLRLTQKKLQITPQVNRGQTETINPTGITISNFQQSNISAGQRASLQKRTRQIVNGCASGSLGVTQPRDTESPSSDISGRNGSRGRVLKQTSGKNLHMKVHTTTSSRTAATTHMGNENTNSSSHSQQLHQAGVHQLRSQSINSDKGLLQQIQSHDAHQLSQNDSGSNILNGMGCTENSPKDTIEADSKQFRSVTVDLTDQAFFANLSWAAGADYVNQKKTSSSKKSSKFLGMQGASSDVVWRYYRKYALERMQLRQIYETKMQATEHLVKKTLSNETIVANQQKNIDQIFEILRSRDLVGNPFGFTMGRNYRFFANMKVQIRRRLARELEQWKARNEAAAASQKPKETTAQKSAAEDTVEMSAQEKELAEVSRFNLILQSQQVLQQQQHEALEGLLEKNKLISRIVVVGLDAPSIK